MARKRIVKIKITLPPGGHIADVQIDTQVSGGFSNYKAKSQLEKIFTLAGWKFQKMEVVI